jgi:hypothetical protein
MDPERATPSSTPRKFSIRSNFGKARQPRSRKNRPCDACRRRKTACVITAEPPCETRPISIHPSIQSIQFPAHYRTIGSISSSLTLNKAIYTYIHIHHLLLLSFTYFTVLYCELSQLTSPPFVIQVCFVKAEACYANPSLIPMSWLLGPDLLLFLLLLITSTLVLEVHHLQMPIRLGVSMLQVPPQWQLQLQHQLRHLFLPLHPPSLRPRPPKSTATGPNRPPLSTTASSGPIFRLYLVKALLTSTRTTLIHPVCIPIRKLYTPLKMCQEGLPMPWH